MEGGKLASKKKVFEQIFYIQLDPLYATAFTSFSF